MGYSASTEIDNPFFPERPKVFSSVNNYPLIDVEEQIVRVLQSKASKKHEGKEQTILIIDNRTTTTSLQEFIKAIDRLQLQFEFLPFPEVWLYTGYGAANPIHGNRLVKKCTDYLLLPIKLETEVYEKYRKREINKG